MFPGFKRYSKQCFDGAKFTCGLCFMDKSNECNCVLRCNDIVLCLLDKQTFKYHETWAPNVQFWEKIIQISQDKRQLFRHLLYNYGKTINQISQDIYSSILHLCDNNHSNIKIHKGTYCITMGRTTIIQNSQDLHRHLLYNYGKIIIQISQNRCLLHNYEKTILQVPQDIGTYCTITGK